MLYKEMVTPNFTWYRICLLQLQFVTIQLMMASSPAMSLGLFLQHAPSIEPSVPTITQEKLFVQRKNHHGRSEILRVLHDSNNGYEYPRLIHNGPSLLSLLSTSMFEEGSRQRIAEFATDTVVRVTDANHVRLERAGLVSLAGIKTPTSSSSTSSGNGIKFSECLSKTPEYKLQRLLPPGTKVKIKLYPSGGSSSSNQQSAVILKQSKDGSELLLVNQELVASGFALVRANSNNEVLAASDIMSIEALRQMEAQARTEGKGLFEQCSGSPGSSAITRTVFVAEFQPLDQKGSSTSTASSTPSKPRNPGDRKGCSDFDSYEDALRFFEYFYPYYGDVARLDRDGDGIPCPGLPHTQNQVLYRLKKPSTVIDAS